MPDQAKPKPDRVNRGVLLDAADLAALEIAARRFGRFTAISEVIRRLIHEEADRVRASEAQPAPAS